MISAVPSGSFGLWQAFSQDWHAVLVHEPKQLKRIDGGSPGRPGKHGPADGLDVD